MQIKQKLTVISFKFVNIWKSFLNVWSRLRVLISFLVVFLLVFFVVVGLSWFFTAHTLLWFWTLIKILIVNDSDILWLVLRPFALWGFSFLIKFFDLLLFLLKFWTLLLNCRNRFFLFLFFAAFLSSILLILINLLLTHFYMLYFFFTFTGFLLRKVNFNFLMTNWPLTILLLNLQFFPVSVCIFEYLSICSSRQLHACVRIHFAVLDFVFVQFWGAIHIAWSERLAVFFDPKDGQILLFVIHSPAHIQSRHDKDNQRH